MSSTTPDIGSTFLAEARRELQACHRKIVHCVDQLNDDQLWWRAGEDFNSIANLLLHLDGNVRQRLLSLIGGEPDTRNRPSEFSERGPIPKEQLIGKLDDALVRSDTLLAELAPERLLETRTYSMLGGEVEGTFTRLIVHTLAHVAGHTQEIVAVTRLQLREGYKFMPAAAP